jgi:large repetitive protein
MANVTWTTPAGSLGIINERDLFSKQLEANSADSTVLTYTKIAGTLPPGIRLTSAGLLRGTPFEVARRSLYTFVIRVSDGINITDRTFSFQVQGADIPQFTTASGQLDLSDTTRVGNKWVLDGSYIEFQIEATDTDTATGQTLIYDISNGRLPPGVTMSTSGLISGTIL